MIPDMNNLARAYEHARDHFDLTKQAQDRLNSEILATYRERFPKRKTPALGKAQDALPDFAPVRFEYYKAVLLRAYRRRDARRDRIGRILDWMAKRRAPVATDSPLVYGESYYSTYRSQGYGCERYTRQDAEQLASDCARCGVKVELVDNTYEEPGKPPYKLGYRVLAYTDRAGLEIIRRKPYSLKAWLQDCWNRGINPRVINPFLPHGLEERLGVSFLPESGRRVSGIVS